MYLRNEPVFLDIIKVDEYYVIYMLECIDYKIMITGSVVRDCVELYKIHNISFFGNMTSMLQKILNKDKYVERDAKKIVEVYLCEGGIL